MADSKRWQATLAEHRTAWIIATLSLLVILIAILQPEWLNRLTASSQDNNPTQQTPAEIKPVHVNQPKYSAVIPAQKATPEEPAPRSNIPGYAAKPLSKTSTMPITPAPTAPKPSTNTATTHSSKTPSPRSTKTAQTRGHYYVQIGAFSNKSHADKLAAKINRNNWSAKVVKKTSKLFAVWVGPRESRSLVNALKSSLEQRLNMKGFIIKQP